MIAHRVQYALRQSNSLTQTQPTKIEVAQLIDYIIPLFAYLK